jgi:hypothetical protein
LCTGLIQYSIPMCLLFLVTNLHSQSLFIQLLHSKPPHDAASTLRINFFFFFFFLFGLEWNWVHYHWGHNWPTVPALDDERGAIGGMTDRANRSTWRKPSLVGSQWLTAWATALPLSVSYCDAFVIYVLCYGSCACSGHDICWHSFVKCRLLEIYTVSSISVSVGIWHLLISYQNHIIKKHLEEIYYIWKVLYILFAHETRVATTTSNGGLTLVLLCLNKSTVLFEFTPNVSVKPC